MYLYIFFLLVCFLFLSLSLWLFWKRTFVKCSRRRLVQTSSRSRNCSRSTVSGNTRWVHITPHHSGCIGLKGSALAGSGFIVCLVYFKPQLEAPARKVRKSLVLDSWGKECLNVQLFSQEQINNNGNAVSIHILFCSAICIQ